MSNQPVARLQHFRLHSFQASLFVTMPKDAGFSDGQYLLFLSLLVCLAGAFFIRLAARMALELETFVACLGHSQLPSLAPVWLVEGAEH